MQKNAPLIPKMELSSRRLEGYIGYYNNRMVKKLKISFRLLETRF